MKRQKQPHGGTLNILEKGETANKNGRPKRLVSVVIADLIEEGYQGVTQAEISEIINILLNVDKARIKELADDDKQPLYVQRTARRLYGATEREIGDYVETLLSRSQGKPRQALEHSGPDGNPIEVKQFIFEIPTPTLTPVYDPDNTSA